MGFIQSLEISASSTFKNLAKYLILKVHKYVYLDIDRYFSTKISYIPRRGSGNGMPSDVPLPLWVALTNTTRPQWKATLKEMEKIWKIIIGCTLLLIPLSIALLQIDMVRTTRWGQMLASTTFTIAVAGMLSGVLFLIEGKSLLYDKVRLLWIEASRHPRDLQSIKFWSRFSLPAVSVAWSLGFASATTLYATLASPVSVPDSHGGSTLEMAFYVLSAAFISALNMYIFFQVFQLKDLLDAGNRGL